jgi:hypothetical protein
LDVRMLSETPEPRIRIEQNYWLSRGEPTDLQSPPSGKSLAARYSNGDTTRVEFIPDLDQEGLGDRYPGVDTSRWGLPPVIAAVEIEMHIAEIGVDFGPRSTRVEGATMTTAS